MSYKIVLDYREENPILNILNEYIIPFELREKVWVCVYRRNKYVVVHGEISGVWATNIVGVYIRSVSFGEMSCEAKKFDQIHKSKQDAIDWCVKQNQRLKVKVYDD